MESTLAEILERHAGDPTFGPAVAAALTMMASARVDEETVPEPVHDSSAYFARVYAFRKQNGRFDRPPVGLDETIAALARSDVPVRMGTARTSLGVIGVWFGAEGSLLGLVVFYAQTR